jgi:uncharacterized protein (UPF0548 family)
MADWRLGRSWSESELRRRLDALAALPVNFDDAPDTMTRERGWTIDGDSAALGREPIGPPVEDGLYERAQAAIANYDFSDPRIVVGHFDPAAPLLDRDMLLEIKVWGLHFLSGVRVVEVRDEARNDTSVFGFRYDTLAGHIERGFEWFLLTKDHRTGEVQFRVEAHWRLGDFPNWWSRAGFLTVGNAYRTLWRHRAPERLRRLAQQPRAKPITAPGAQLAHRGDETPQRTEGRS